MLTGILPDNLNGIIESIGLENICEIRLRINSPIVISISGEYYFLSEKGISKEKKDSFICKNHLIKYIVERASNNSLHTINDQLIKGFISIAGGVRIGVAGEFVYIDNKIKTIKNIHSLNIRIPREVKDCSLNSYLYLINNKSIYNTLILSPAGAGKTTYIRDLAQQICKRNELSNILVVDERNEITGIFNNFTYFSNCNFDIYSNCTKKFAFENGIRSMRPDVIITDELNMYKDIEVIENAITTGVKIIATVHADNINDLKNKQSFANIIAKKMFNRYILLSSNNGPGTLEGVYDENLRCIFC